MGSSFGRKTYFSNSFYCARNNAKLLIFMGSSQYWDPGLGFHDSRTGYHYTESLLARAGFFRFYALRIIA